MEKYAQITFAHWWAVFHYQEQDHSKKWFEIFSSESTTCKEKYILALLDNFMHIFTRPMSKSGDKTAIKFSRRAVRKGICESSNNAYVKFRVASIFEQTQPCPAKVSR